MKTFLIYLADDHELVAKGISNLLQSIEYVGEVVYFKNGEELLKACEKQVPDIIFLDLEMPVLNGLQTLPKLKQYTTISTIVLSMNDERPIIEQAMSLGAKGFLNKNCEVNDLKRAMEAVTSGQLFFSEEIKKNLVGLKQKLNSDTFKLEEELTEREKEVLTFICDGLSTKEIAEKLYLSSRTIESHKNTLMKKFDVNSTGKLISLAIKNKLVQ